MWLPACKAVASLALSTALAGGGGRAALVMKAKWVTPEDNYDDSAGRAPARKDGRAGLHHVSLKEFFGHMNCDVRGRSYTHCEVTPERSAASEANRSWRRAPDPQLLALSTPAGLAANGPRWLDLERPYALEPSEVEFRQRGAEPTQRTGLPKMKAAAGEPAGEPAGKADKASSKRPPRRQKRRAAPDVNSDPPWPQPAAPPPPSYFAAAASTATPRTTEERPASPVLEQLTDITSSTGIVPSAAALTYGSAKWTACSARSPHALAPGRCSSRSCPMVSCRVTPSSPKCSRPSRDTSSRPPSSHPPPRTYYSP